MLVAAWFVATTVWLAIIDLRTHTLPNREVGVALVGQLILIFAFLVITDAGGLVSRLAQVAAGALALFIIYLVVQVLSGGKFGLGDVKFSVQFGAVGGLMGLDTWLWMMLTPYVLAGLFALLMLVRKKMSLADHLAFGPFMTLGGLLVVSSAAGQVLV